jgi:Cu2+-exporting ATPase
VFDKTMKDDELVAYAASIDQYSEHPIAKGIVKNAKEKWDVDNFRAIPGKGAEGIVRARTSKPSAPVIYGRKRSTPPTRASRR